MKRKTYPAEFKEQALSKARQRGAKTLPDIADELNLSLGTLKNWLKESGKARSLNLPGEKPAPTWGAAQRLAALNESHSLKDQALHAWCREKGLFEHQLRQWQREFCNADEPAATPVDAALRQAKQKNEQLERELRRKDKALAEAAALLVLQKKFQALWEDEEK
ncbi:transposase [Rhodoferax antarcticus]|uniref:transposase n=1 Tax=Rhodoferax antarcticus TaxID=81479 RepID=UPI0022252DCA|nr:transposase [Rhodoferax antarcticus]MCW2311497.1 transposase-like protein [Rhodoferax antarcticus]